METHNIKGIIPNERMEINEDIANTIREEEIRRVIEEERKKHEGMM